VRSGSLLVCVELRAGVFFWREWIGLFGGDFSLIEAEAEVELRGEVEWGGELSHVSSTRHTSQRK